MTNLRYFSTMNGMRAMLLACCVAAVPAAAMLAQDPAPPPPGAQQEGPPPEGRRNPAEMEQRRLDMMTKQLNLTPDQVTKVKSIMESEREQMRALRQSNGGQQGDNRSQMMAIRSDSITKTRAILNDDQKTKFDAMQQRQRDRMQHGGGPDGPGGPSPAPPSTPQ